MILNFTVIYSAIYEFSHSENGLAMYSLDKAGNTRYEEFIDGISASLKSQWARNICPDVSKDDRHVLRLAAVLHVFYDQLTKFLQGEEKSPPPQVITSTTIQRSITLCKYFTTQRRILDQVSGRSIIKQLVKLCVTGLWRHKLTGGTILSTLVTGNKKRKTSFCNNTGVLE